MVLDYAEQRVSYSSFFVFLAIHGSSIRFSVNYIIFPVVFSHSIV